MPGCLSVYLISIGVIFDVALPFLMNRLRALRMNPLRLDIIMIKQEGRPGPLLPPFIINEGVLEYDWTFIIKGLIATLDANVFQRSIFSHSF